MEKFDVCVVGAGVEGSSTARYLASRGTRTLLLEQFFLPHSRGSSHGQSRIIRYGYKEPFYADLMPEAFSIWEEIEQISGKSLIKKAGVLSIEDPPYEEVSGTIENVRRLGQPCLSLSAEEIMKRYPALRLMPHERGVLEPTSGVIQAGLAVQTLQEQFVMFGGILHDGEKVLDIKPGSEVTIQTNKATYKAKKVILTPGPWANELLSPLGVTLPICLERIDVTFWKVTQPELFSMESGFPAFIFYTPLGKKEWNSYGFPIFEYPGLVKIVSHAGTKVKDADNREKEPKDETLINRTKEIIKTMFHGLKTEPSIVESCIYSVTPDFHFVIDKHPNFHNIIIGAGFSGHGFKMAPVIGKILSQLALGEVPKYDISHFKISRFQHIGPNASL